MTGFVMGFLPVTYGNLRGSIDTSINYYVYLKQGNGYILKSYPASSTELVETNKENSKLVEKYTIVCVPKSLQYSDLPQKYQNMFSIDKFYNASIEDNVKKIWIFEKQYLIIPSNTIKKQFNASIQK